MGRSKQSPFASKVKKILLSDDNVAKVAGHVPALIGAASFACCLAMPAARGLHKPPWLATWAARPAHTCDKNSEMHVQRSLLYVYVAR